MVYQNKKLQDWACELEEIGCNKCTLANLCRTKVVVCRGSYDAPIMIVGQNPGAEEDKNGEPFVGRAGKLLDKMFECINIDTNTQCYLTNACLCWTPNNENPTNYLGVLETCQSYLEQQIHLLNPKLIVAVGKPAFTSITHRVVSNWIREVVGNPYSWTFRWEDGDIGSYIKSIPVFPIMHPAYLLRNEDAKSAAWERMIKLSRLIGKIGALPGYVPKE